MANKKESEKEVGTYDFSNYKKDSLTRPRDLAWTNWAKFEKVGDKIQGFVVDAFFRPAEGLFKEQRGITIKQEDGSYINVGNKRLPFILSKTDDVRIGDPLTIEFVEEKAPQQKGFSPTKIFGYYSPVPSMNLQNKTVKQLEDEDIARGGSKAPEAVESEAVPFE